MKRCVSNRKALIGEAAGPEWFGVYASYRHDEGIHIVVVGEWGAVMGDLVHDFISNSSYPAEEI